MPIELNTPKTHLTPEAEKRIQRHLDSLEKRLAKFSNPQTIVTIRDRTTERRFTADILLQTGVDGTEMVSHQSGETAEQAVRQGVEDIERQLERYVSGLRGEPSFGTPSRREPREQRPALVTDQDDFDTPPDLDPDTE